MVARHLRMVPTVNETNLCALNKMRDMQEVDGTTLPVIHQALRQPHFIVCLKPMHQDGLCYTRNEVKLPCSALNWRKLPDLLVCAPPSCVLRLLVLRPLVCSVFLCALPSCVLRPLVCSAFLCSTFLCAPPSCLLLPRVCSTFLCALPSCVLRAHVCSTFLCALPSCVLRPHVCSTFLCAPPSCVLCPLECSALLCAPPPLYL